MAIDFTPVNDFFSNIKDKLTNPFFGTLIIVWITRNWILVYTLFNFDEKHNLKTKVEFIKNYWSTKDFLEDLAISAFHALLFMLAGYIIIMATRGISIFVEHNAMPWITKKVINKNYVLKEQFDNVSDERTDYFNKFEDERSRVRTFSKDYEEQSKILDQLKKQHIELEVRSSKHFEDFMDQQKDSREKSLNIQEMNQNISSLERNKLKIEADLNFYFKNYTYAKELLSENEELTSILVYNSKIIYDLTNNIISSNLTGRFVSVMSYFKNGGGISSESISLLEELNLIIRRTNENESPTIYAHLIYRHILNEKSIINDKFLETLDQIKSNIK